MQHIPHNKPSRWHNEFAVRRSSYVFLCRSARSGSVAISSKSFPSDLRASHFIDPLYIFQRSSACARCVLYPAQSCEEAPLGPAMGRVRTKTVKRTARIIVEKYYGKLTLDFQVTARNQQRSSGQSRCTCRRSCRCFRNPRVTARKDGTAINQLAVSLEDFVRAWNSGHLVPRSSSKHLSGEQEDHGGSCGDSVEAAP